MKSFSLCLLFGAVLISSCSILNTNSTKTVTAQSPQYVITERDVEVNSSEGDASAPTPVTPTNRNAGTAGSDEECAAPKNLSSDLDGEWIVMEVNGEKVEGDDRPYFVFDSSTGMYYGSNGCNTLNGKYIAEEGGKLSLSDGASTLMMCPDAKYEHIINVAMGEVVGYGIENAKGESLLSLRSLTGRVVMVLKRANINFLNGAWKLKAIGGDASIVTDRMQFVFDVQNLKIHGNAGCNIVNGKMFLDPDQPGSVQFLDLMSTRMACPDMSAETKALSALEETAVCELLDDGNMVFKSFDGKELLLFEKM